MIHKPRLKHTLFRKKEGAATRGNGKEGGRASAKEVEKKM